MAAGNKGAGVIQPGKKFQTGEAVQALHVKQANHQHATVGASSANVAVGGADIVRVSSTVDMFIWWGSSAAVTADVNSMVFPAGVEVLVVPPGMTHLAFLQVTSSGSMTLTQMGESNGD